MNHNDFFNTSKYPFETSISDILPFILLRSGLANEGVAVFNFFGTWFYQFIES